MIASRFFQRHRFASGVGSALLVVSLLFAAGAAAVSFPRTAGHCPEMSCVGKRQAASGVTYRGTWKPGTRYHKNDIVYSGGSSYVAKKPSSHLAPATHHAAWGLLARGGTSANVVSGHAEDQNSFVYVDSTTTPIVAVQLSGVGGQPLSVGSRRACRSVVLSGFATTPAPETWTSRSAGRRSRCKAVPGRTSGPR